MTGWCFLNSVSNIFHHLKEVIPRASRCDERYWEQRISAARLLSKETTQICCVLVAKYRSAISWVRRYISFCLSVGDRGCCVSISASVMGETEARKAVLSFGVNLSMRMLLSIVLILSRSDSQKFRRTFDEVDSMAHRQPHGDSCIDNSSGSIRQQMERPG